MQLRAFDKPRIRKQGAIGGENAEFQHLNASRDPRGYRDARAIYVSLQNHAFHRHQDQNQPQA